jgi:hypothetical protein
MASVQPVNETTKPEASSTDSGDESDVSDAYDDVIEVSPCGRWEKRRIEVNKSSLFGHLYEVLLIVVCRSVKQVDMVVTIRGQISNMPSPPPPPPHNDKIQAGPVNSNKSY